MDDPYRTALEERIDQLQRYRWWLRDHDIYGPVNRAALIREYRIEAGALNRVRNRVRKAQHVDARGDHFVGIGR